MQLVLSCCSSFVDESVADVLLDLVAFSDSNVLLRKVFLLKVNAVFTTCWNRAMDSLLSSECNEGMRRNSVELTLGMGSNAVGGTSNSASVLQ